MRKLLLSIITLFLILSCDNSKKENLKKLNTVIANVDIALKSPDREFIEMVIDDIESVELLYPDQQSLKEKKFALEIKLKKYSDAIKTIDSLLVLSPDDVDNRIIQGILYEITGSKVKSIEVLETALEKINIKIENMLKEDEQKVLTRKLNRLLILKLLNRDSHTVYSELKSEIDLDKYPSLYQLVLLIEGSPRDTFINNYR